jgi:hypothetical protein
MTWENAPIAEATFWLHDSFRCGASSTVGSARVADGYTILVIALTGNATGTFDGPFTETDHEVIRPDGSATLRGTGTQFGTLGTCGTGSVRYVTGQQEPSLPSAAGS